MLYIYPNMIITQSEELNMHPNRNTQFEALYMYPNMKNTQNEIVQVS